MRASWIMLCVLSATAVASSALAQSKPASNSDSSSKPAASSSTAERKDPNGVTGISPYMELLVKGHSAATAKDYAKAIEFYKEAIAKEPERAAGFYYLGEAQLASNKLDDAEKSWQTALKFAGADDAMRAKVMFVLADLRERQGKLDDAIAAWKEYGTFVSAHPNSKGYAATATEREKVLETRKDMVAKYTKVKERIAQRIEESSKGSK